jgi:hypothetical protein
VSAAIDDLAGYDAVGENAAFVVNIAQEEIEGGDALGQAAFDAVPLRAGNQAGQQIIRKDFLGPFLAPVNREGNALVIASFRIAGALLRSLRTFAIFAVKSFLPQRTQRKTQRKCGTPTSPSKKLNINKSKPWAGIRLLC